MQFEYIHLLWILWLVPLLLALYLYAYRRKQTMMQVLLNQNLNSGLLINFSIRVYWIKVSLILFAVLLLVLALVRPKWGFQWEEVQQRGVDIMIALDVSSSMMAEDVQPNRLLRAKREIIDLLDIVEGDRIGLIAFAGASFVQAPLTLDYGAVMLFLDELNQDLIPVPGTAIAQAIDQAIDSFQQAADNSSVLILITDGEDHAGNPLAAAERALNANIRVYTIGIGDDSGAPIPDGIGGFKKDRQGELILTQLDQATLQSIALKTGGAYVRSVTGDLDLETIYADIRANVQDRELQGNKRKRYLEQYQWPLALAILLLMWELALGGNIRQRIQQRFNQAESSASVNMRGE